MTPMTKRERLEATIAHEPTDRLPIAVWRHWPGDDQNAESLAAAHLLWQERYDWDFVKVSPSSSYCLADWGVESRWLGNVEGTRDYTRRIIHHPEAWADLKPLEPDQGSLAVQVEALRLLREAWGERVPFLATIFSPLAQAKNLAGKEQALSHMRSHPQHFRQGLETITESTMRLVEAARETGISGIYYAIQHARHALLSGVEYKTFGQPYDEQILGEASDLWLNTIHLHGDQDLIFDVVADYDVPLLNWHDRDSNISLREGRDQFAGALSGGVSRSTMHTGDPEAVLAEARNAVEQTGGRGLVLGTGCVIMTNTPLRNLQALRHFAEDWKPQPSPAGNGAPV
ncbi:MAG: uroporphyrinogen decarboxylase family protein [Candidatus Promineifilaceae bacterium]|nr:uroporphyrinogen decarboxylase family protein [Candidatus Promineifilaceae bacterium]